MTWGVKKEASIPWSKWQARLEVSRQLPTADDAILNEVEGLRFNWFFSIRYPTWLGKLLQNVLAFYKSTASGASLRSAIFAYFDESTPYQKQREFFLHRSIALGSKKSASDLDESDLIASSLLGHVTMRLAFRERTLQYKIPSRSTHLKRFLELMKKLLAEANGNVSQYAFGQYWFFFILVAIRATPLDRANQSILELFQLSGRLFDIFDLPTWNKIFGRLFPNDCWTSNVLAWREAIVHHGYLLMQSFWTWLERRRDRKSTENLIPRTELENMRRALSMIELSEVHQQILHVLTCAGMGRFHQVRIQRVNVWFVVRNYRGNMLLLTLMLDGDTLLQAASQPSASVYACNAVLEIAPYYDTGIPPDTYTSIYNIHLTVLASLVYPISRVPQGNSIPVSLLTFSCSVRKAVMKILSWACLWVGETVQKYWLDPEKYLDEMLEMVRSIWKSTMQMEGGSMDFEEGADQAVQFWN